MSRRLSFLLIATLVFAFLAPAIAEAQFFPAFQKLTADDDDFEDNTSGFPPSHACMPPCAELHSIIRIINCGALNPDGSCGIPNPPLTGGEVVDVLPASLILDCVRGVIVTGDGTWDPPVCDVAANTVTVSNIDADSGGTVEISFWATIDCENGITTNQATLEWDQNPAPGTLQQARDPASAFGGGGLMLRVGTPVPISFTKDIPVLAISGNPPMRTAPPGSQQHWVIEGANPACEAVTITDTIDTDNAPGCMAVDCDSLRMFINDIPTPLPADSDCPDPVTPSAFRLGEFVLQPGDSYRLEYDAVFTGIGGPECCNLTAFRPLGLPEVQTSDPGLESDLTPEFTCVVLGDTPQPVLDIVKAAEDEFGNPITSIEPGEIIDWRFTITNRGDADGMEDLTDTFPALAILTPGSIITPFPSGVCTITGQDLECIGITLTAGESIEMVVRTTVDCSATGDDTICNEGQISSPAGPQVTHCPTCPAQAPGNETCVQVTAPAFSFATKTAMDADGDGVVDVGETITWNIDPLNSGTTDGRNVVLTDVVPAGTSYVPGTLALDGVALTDGADGDAGEVVGSDITVRLGDVTPVSGLNIVTFDTLVDSVADAAICNDAAALAWDTAAACPDGSFGLAPACVPTTSAPNVSATKSVTPVGNVQRGAVLTYSIEACNDAAAAAATGVLVEDIVPAGSTYVNGTMTLDGGSLTDAADADAGEIVAGPPETVSVLVDDLAPGECRTVTFDVAIDGDASGAVSNTASVSADGVPPFDTNQVDTGIDVPNPAELSALKSVMPFGSVEPGATLTYSIATCNGPTAAMVRNVTVDDDIPAGSTYTAGTIALDGAPLTDIVDVDAGEFDAGPPARVLVTVGDLNPGECKTVTFDVTVDLDATGPILNTATVAAEGVREFDTNEVETPVGVIVVDPPILSVTKTSTLQGMPPARVGETIDYTITACNDAAAGPAAGVVVTDLIPLDAGTGCGGAYVPGTLTIGGVAQTDAADGDAGRFDAAPAPGQIVADIDTLAPGECVDVTFQITVEAACDDTETVDNTASLAATDVPSMDSNTTSDAVGVIVPPDEPVMLRKEGGPLVDQCPDRFAMCGCIVGNRLDVVADDCLVAGTCAVLDPVSWTVAGDQLTGGATLVFYEIDGAGCRQAGDTDDLRVEKSGTDDIVVRLVP